MILTLLCIAVFWRPVLFVLFCPLARYYIIREFSDRVVTDHASVEVAAQTAHTFGRKLRIAAEGATRFVDLTIARVPSHTFRRFVYRFILGVKMEKGSTVYYGAEIRGHIRLHIGQGSIIGDNALLDARNHIDIGRNVNLSSRVSIYTEQHDYQDPYFRCTGRKEKRVVVDDYAWIGPNTVILPGVQIGRGAVVAAGAVVVSDVAPFSVVGGIPAKEIARRNEDLRYSFDGPHIPFY